jgi:hypothetical protein
MLLIFLSFFLGDNSYIVLVRLGQKFNRPDRLKIVSLNWIFISGQVRELENFFNFNEINVQ